MSTKDWIVLLVPIICNGIIVFAFQKILNVKKLKDIIKDKTYEMIY